MAKGVYVGVGGIARKVKKIYAGAETDIPMYGPDTTVSVTESNVAEYFEVANGSYYFLARNGVWTSNNKGISSSKATTTFTAKADIKSLSFSYSYSGESGYDKLTLKVAGTAVANGLSGTTTTKTWSGSMKKGDKIELEFSKDSSGNSYDDCATLSNLSVTVQTIEGYQKKSVAKKVKKGYVGVGGVARPFLTGGEVSYYGTITPLSIKRGDFAAVSIGDYALFGGGYDSRTDFATVDAYSRSLVRSTPTGLSVARSDLAATSVGDYALFGGGGTLDNASSFSKVDAYSRSLVRSTPTGLSVARYGLDATTLGDYALFGGGRNSNSEFATVDAYNRSLTRSTPTQLSIGRGGLAATSVGDYALFGGGFGGTRDRVDAYNRSLTRSNPEELSAGRDNVSATTVGDYALFGGGRDFGSVVDAYNRSLVRRIPAGFDKKAYSMGAASIKGYALFGGGEGNTSSQRVEVYAYDESLTRSTPTGLSVARCILSATTIGDYALFGGGRAPTGFSSAVDVYVVK